MSKTNKKHLQNVILELLKIDDRCKADDIYLFCKVNELITQEKGVYSDDINQLLYLLLKYSKDLENFKTVLRYRQKFQAEDESLKIEPVSTIRAKLEQDFREEFKG